MYEKRLTFSWNRQPSQLKGKPACLSVFQVSEHLPDGGERLIYQDVRLQANDLEPELRRFFHRLSRRPAQHRRERGAA